MADGSGRPVEAGVAESAANPEATAQEGTDQAAAAGQVAATRVAAAKRPPAKRPAAVRTDEVSANRFAVLSLVLSPTVLGGLFFSIGGLVRVRAYGGAGRGLALLGMVLSAAFLTGYIWTGVHYTRPTAPDPACAPAIGGMERMVTKTSSDEQAAESASGNPTALKAALNSYVGDLQQIVQVLKAAQPKAQSAAVRSAISDTLQDLQTDVTDLSAFAKGDSSQSAAAEAASNRLGNDAKALEAACPGVG